MMASLSVSFPLNTPPSRNAAHARRNAARGQEIGSFPAGALGFPAVAHEDDEAQDLQDPHGPAHDHQHKPGQGHRHTHHVQDHLVFRKEKTREDEAAERHVACSQD